MIKKLPSVVAAMLLSLAAVGQEVCTTPDETVADPNSITKCAVEDTDNGAGKQLSIEVSTRRRVVRKNKEAVSAIGGINSSQKVADIKKNSLLVGKLELEDNSATIEKIPFNLVEEIPLFDKCNNVPLIKQAKCFETNMTKHIVKNFNYPQEALDAGIQGRVLVQFTINEQGDVESILMRGPEGGESLEKEASRIINNLPKFIPGKHNGKNVKVKYGVPITFKAPGASNTKTTNVNKTSVANTSKVVKEKEITDFVKFAEVQSIPQFKACTKVADMQKLNCFNERMISHIQRNFNYPAGAAEQNIEGRVWVRFIIDKNGDVSNIKMKGPENGQLLEQEAKKMVANLPTFVPAKHNGKSANVEYYIPINFKLHE
ncbi:TonB family protein [Tenacibaculum lutimaris]|uniref:TonB family protein n=1 Tax=Tenacibaculum lutimaris TaxID=285258 RepID=A0A420DZA6_9FLAO|nr:energy transducer TonB [Tenacibaculum lutimaris]RKF03171.1 TonB family protein [Tenacibaculum lutimaris]